MLMKGRGIEDTRITKRVRRDTWEKGIKRTKGKGMEESRRIELPGKKVEEGGTTTKVR